MILNSLIVWDDWDLEVVLIQIKTTTSWAQEFWYDVDGGIANRPFSTRFELSWACVDNITEVIGDIIIRGIVTVVLVYHQAETVARTLARPSEWVSSSMVLSSSRSYEWTSLHRKVVENSTQLMRSQRLVQIRPWIKIKISLKFQISRGMHEKKKKKKKIRIQLWTWELNCSRRMVKGFTGEASPRRKLPPPTEKWCTLGRTLEGPFYYPLIVLSFVYWKLKLLYN